MRRRLLCAGLGLLLACLAPASAMAQDDQGETVEVPIRNFIYEPTKLTVAPGTTVEWTNLDFAPHTVTWDDKSVDSGLFGQGETFSYTFDEPGTYPYYCIPHGSPGHGMIGVIVVADQ